MGILLSKAPIKLIHTDVLVNWLFLRNVNYVIPQSVVSSSGALPDQFSTWLLPSRDRWVVPSREALVVPLGSFFQAIAKDSINSVGISYRSVWWVLSSRDTLVGHSSVRGLGQ